jgi:hypothetical protein
MKIGIIAIEGEIRSSRVRPFGGDMALSLECMQWNVDVGNWTGGRAKNNLIHNFDGRGWMAGALLVARF